MIVHVLQRITVWSEILVGTSKNHWNTRVSEQKLRLLRRQLKAICNYGCLIEYNLFLRTLFSTVCAFDRVCPIQSSTRECCLSTNGGLSWWLMPLSSSSSLSSLLLPLQADRRSRRNKCLIDSQTTSAAISSEAKKYYCSFLRFGKQRCLLRPCEPLRQGLTSSECVKVA